MAVHVGGSNIRIYQGGGGTVLSIILGVLHVVIPKYGLLAVVPLVSLSTKVRYQSYRRFSRRGTKTKILLNHLKSYF